MKTRYFGIESISIQYDNKVTIAAIVMPYFCFSPRTKN